MGSYTDGDGISHGFVASPTPESSSMALLIMSLIAMVFLGSYFEPPRNLAFLLSFGFAASFVGDVWIFRALAN